MPNFWGKFVFDHTFSVQISFTPFYWQIKKHTTAKIDIEIVSVNKPLFEKGFLMFIFHHI